MIEFVCAQKKWKRNVSCVLKVEKNKNKRKCFKKDNKREREKKEKYEK